MTGYILKRIGVALLIVFIVVTAVFFAFRMGGVDPTAMMLSPDATLEDQVVLTEKFGLDKSLPVQYLNFVKNVVLHGDFGQSFIYSEPALTSLLVRFPATLQLGLVAFFLALCIGVPIGILSAVKRDSWLDRVSRIIAFGGMSLPIFWVAVMLILFFGVELQILPISGKDTPLHYIMPAFCMSLYPIALFIRLSRSAMIDVLKNEYVVMARIKGVPEKYVILLHALKNASITLVTVAFSVFGAMLSGAVVVELIFSWPGVGRFVMEAFFRRDYPVVQVFVMFMGVLVTVLNLLVDITYAYIDPRIRYH